MIRLIEGKGSLNIPSPLIGTPTIVPEPTAVQDASDAVDALANAVKHTIRVKDELEATEQAIADLSVQKETTVVKDELENTQQTIANLVAQSATLEGEYLLGAEKQNALASNISQRQNTANPEALLRALQTQSYQPSAYNSLVGKQRYMSKFEEPFF